VVRPFHVLVTGTYRSGTTLAERLIDNLADGFCAPQPFPFLYLSAKRRFLAEAGLDGGRYPIGTGFHDPLHQPDELAAYLGSTVFDHAFVEGALESMQGYSGAQTPDIASAVQHIPPGPFASIVRAMHDALAARRSPGATVVGSKEILLEEFVPTFGAADVSVVLVVRDPRALIASTIGPAAGAWSGRVRPLLYTIQLWRKTVAYALRYREHVSAVRFEDLIASPEETLRGVFAHLDIPIDTCLPPPLSPDHMLGADGSPFVANTSFPDGDVARPPRFGLSDRQLAFVDAVVGPEMRAFGYPPSSPGVPAERALEALRPEDDPGHDHPDFAPGYSVDPERLDAERRRLELLGDTGASVDERAWFVLPGVGAQLAAGGPSPITAPAIRAPKAV
jgi:hypothetical protein